MQLQPEPGWMSMPSRAVFLSYASEDAAAAQRIADSLRSAAIEVWFDQSELRGGEAWDRQIRRQIHECALFIPVISAGAHARDEGYFRLEWKLAADRSHLMAPDRAFLLPVVIDDTPRTDQRIPDRLRELQWSHLPEGRVPAAFIDRVRQLLSPAAAVVAGASQAPAAGSAAAATTARRRWLIAGVIGALAAGALLAGGYALWRSPWALGLLGAREAAQGGLSARTVAVLPFENLSAAASDAYLAAGIAESVLHRLAGVKSLAVIARTSSFTFRGRDVDARNIGRTLNARYLVEGSVQRAGDRLRVTAQLLDASSGRDVWSLRFDRRMGDIFELQDDISGKVTDAVGVSLATPQGSNAERRTPKLDAYLAYIEGRSLLSSYKIADAQEGIERLRRATAIDPNFAAAYAEQAHGLRFLQWLLHPEKPTDPEIERQAAALIDKALALDPDLGEAWVERAWGRQELTEGFDATTDAEFRKGLALSPSYAQGYERYGEWLQLIGRTDDALAMIERARQLDPLAPRIPYMQAMILMEKGHTDQAVQLYLETLRVSPTYHPALTRLGMIESFRGNFAEAVKFSERAITLEPQAQWMRSFAAAVYLDMGDVAAAQDVMAAAAPEAPMRLCILSYSGEAQRGAALLYALPHDALARALDFDSPCGTALLRDDALERRDYGRALHALEPCLAPDWDPLITTDRGYMQALCAIHYASILTAMGRPAQAAKLLHPMLNTMQRYPQFTSGQEAEARGLALAVLGDSDGAVTALQASYAKSKWGWWYHIRYSPQLERDDPRFQKLAQEVRDRSGRQAALLAAMRRAGDVPYRPASSKPPASGS